LLAADTGQPLPYADILLGGRAIEQSRSTSTDDRGVYEFPNLPAGSYSVLGRKPGYVLKYLGRRNARVQTAIGLDLTDGQVLDTGDFALARAAVIEGRLLDDSGDPIAGARVRTMRARYTNGERQLAYDEGRSGSTDDLGRFRIFNLEAGAHYLIADISNVVDTDKRPSIFYPGTFSPTDAQPIILKTGQEVSGIALQFVPTRMVNVSGSVRLSSGAPATGPSLTTGLSLLISSGGVSRAALVRPDGTFLLPNVVPGDYQLYVQADSSKEALFGSLNVPTSDLTLALSTSTGSRVTGRIVFDGATPAGLRPSDVRLSVTGISSRVASQSMAQTIADDWSFEMRVVGVGLLRAAPGSATRLTASDGLGFAPPWMLKRVTRRGVDITDTLLDFNAGVDDLEVVLTSQMSGVTGTVVDSRGQAVRDVPVVVFADDRRQWTALSRTTRATRTTQSGRFALNALPPGTYFVAAVDFADEGSEQDPRVLEEIRRSATSLTVAEGETRNVELKLVEP
jgi:hypothetical protein